MAKTEIILPLSGLIKHFDILESSLCGLHKLRPGFFYGTEKMGIDGIHGPLGSFCVFVEKNIFNIHILSKYFTHCIPVSFC